MKNDNKVPALLDVFGRNELLKVRIADGYICVDEARVVERIRINDTHQIIRGQASIVIIRSAKAIPLVDLRAPLVGGRELIGAWTLIISVRRNIVGLIVEEILESIDVQYASLTLPNAAMRKENPYLVGSFNKDGEKVLIIDVDRFLGPVIGKYNLSRQ